MLKKIFISLCIASSLESIAQDVISLGQEQSLDLTGTQTWKSPIVFVSESGSAVAFLNSVNNSPTSNSIYYSELRPNTTTWTEPTLITTIGSNKEVSYTNAAMNAAGEGIVVLNTQAATTTLQSFRFHLTASGVVIDPILTANTGLKTYDPAVGIDGRGNVLLAWRNGTASSAGALVYGSSLLKNSSSWTQPLLVASPSSTRTCNAVRVAMNSKGQGVILWNDWVVGSGFYGQFYSNRASFFKGNLYIDGVNMRLPSDTSGLLKQENDVAVGIDQDGNILAAWRYGQDGTSAPLEGSILYSTASAWGDKITFSTGNYNHNLSLSINAEGYAVVAWQNGTGSNGGTAPYNIFARGIQINQNSYTLGSLITAATLGSNKLQYPSVCVDQYKNFVISWNSGTATKNLAYYPSGMTSTQSPLTLANSSADVGETAGIYINQAQTEKGVAVWANQGNILNYAQPFYIINPYIFVVDQCLKSPCVFQN